MPTRPTTQRARRLRQVTNEPEAKAWAVLRRLRQYGFPVRRQHPVGPFIADFAVTRAKLIVEIDGSVHVREDVCTQDDERQAYLQERGWKVVRFTADEAKDADLIWGRITEILGL